MLNSNPTLGLGVVSLLVKLPEKLLKKLHPWKALLIKLQALHKALYKAPYAKFGRVFEWSVSSA